MTEALQRHSELFLQVIKNALRCYKTVKDICLIHFRGCRHAFGSSEGDCSSTQCCQCPLVRMTQRHMVMGSRERPLKALPVLALWSSAWGFSSPEGPSLTPPPHPRLTPSDKHNCSVFYPACGSVQPNPTPPAQPEGRSRGCFQPQVASAS